MNLSISNNLVGHSDPIQMPVSELLTGTYHFTIPSYQRGYRWESGDGVHPNEDAKQVDDLLNDLTSFVVGNTNVKPNYYLQPLMVKPRQNQQSVWEWEVLDGQQRLTTILLILKCLNEKLMMNNPLKLFTIRYDNRPLLDFNRITYDKNNQIDYNYPLPNSNQDSFYVRKAKDRIEKWYEDKIDGDTQLQDKLKDALIYADPSRGVNSTPSLRAIFIWYNVEPVGMHPFSTKGRIHDIEVFNRLNRGKISLTESELIKALFILKLKKYGSPHGSSLTIETLVKKWDDMGRKFQDDGLWKMISPRNKEYQNRLDLLFDFIRESDNNSKEKSSYLYFYKKMAKLLAVSDLEVLWDEIKRHFDKLCKWHEDAHSHNFVGYLVECGKSISGINREIGNKSSVIVLKEMVKKVLKTRGILFDASGEPTVEELNYKEHSDAIRKVLLLFNVVACDKYGQKFPFDSYRDFSYDIEHVNSQTENPIEKIEEKIEWIKEQAFQCLMEDRLEMDKATNHWTQSAVIARELIIEGVQLLRHFKDNDNKDIGNRFKPYRIKVESYYAYGNPTVSNALISADRDSLGNLNLLNSSINREYKNALYPNKLKTLKRCDQEGVYIPLCTKYLFLKYYTNTSNSASAFNMMRWRKEDQEDYLKTIKFTLKNALL